LYSTLWLAWLQKMFLITLVFGSASTSQ
jgi:hypothetical protein